MIDEPQPLPEGDPLPPPPEPPPEFFHCVECSGSGLKDSMDGPIQCETCGGSGLREA